MYKMKRLLRAINGRLWPLAFLAVLLLIMIASDNHNIHTLPLANTILGGLHGDGTGNFSSSLTEWAGWVIFVIVCLLVLRLIIGAFASDNKAFIRLNTWLMTDRSKALHCSVIKAFNPREYGNNKPDLQIDKRTGRSGKDSVNFPLVYRLIVRAKTKAGKARPSRVTIYFQESVINETWRVRDIYETIGRHPAIAPTPVVLLNSRLQSARDTALLERLGDEGQFMKLEGSFSDVFDVYVPRGTELEALDLLSPDVMAMIEGEAPDIDIKFDNAYITFFYNGYIFDTVKLQEFEQKIAKVIAGLDRYLSKRKRQLDTKGWAKMDTSASIKPIALLTDRLIGWGFLLFLLTVIGNFVLGIFVKSRDLHLGKQVFTVLPAAADIGVLVMYAVLALLFIVFVLGELEVGLHRLRLFFITRRARSLYRLRASNPAR